MEGGASGKQKQEMVWLPLKHLDLIIIQSGWGGGLSQRQWVNINHLSALL